MRKNKAEKARLSVYIDPQVHHKMRAYLKGVHGYHGAYGETSRFVEAAISLRLLMIETRKEVYRLEDIRFD